MTMFNNKSKSYETILPSVYYLNPEYFFKGKILDRTNIIKNIVEYKFV